jgi:CBS domain-containing protein
MLLQAPVAAPRLPRRRASTAAAAAAAAAPPAHAATPRAPAAHRRAAAAAASTSSSRRLAAAGRTRATEEAAHPSVAISLGDVLVQSVMTPQPITVAPTASVFEVLEVRCVCGWGARGAHACAWVRGCPCVRGGFA